MFSIEQKKNYTYHPPNTSFLTDMLFPQAKQNKRVETLFVSKKEGRYMIDVHHINDASTCRNSERIYITVLNTKQLNQGFSFEYIIRQAENSFTHYITTKVYDETKTLIKEYFDTLNFGSNSRVITFEFDY